MKAAAQIIRDLFVPVLVKDSVNKPGTRLLRPGGRRGPVPTSRLLWDGTTHQQVDKDLSRAAGTGRRLDLQLPALCAGAGVDISLWDFSISVI